MDLCPTCGSSSLKEEDRSYRMRESGLDYLVIERAQFKSCLSCGEEMLSIPDLQGLMTLVARLIITNGRVLGSQEMRYLRKWLVGQGLIPEEERGRHKLADLLCVPSPQLEKIEQGKGHLRRPEDRLLRVLVGSYLRLEPPKLLADLEKGFPYQKLLRVRRNESFWEEVRSLS